MNKQTTNTILMIKPVRFGYNHQTAVNNYFQQHDSFPADNIQKQALHEFELMVNTLTDHGINMIVFGDSPEPHTPDSIFPNNWISFHEEGHVIIYPMYAENRRQEKRRDITEYLKQQGFYIRHIINYSDWEKTNKFLEGTGSMVLDRANRIAYAAVSERTDRDLFSMICKVLNFNPVVFHSCQTSGGNRLPVYHTNVMMCITDKYAVICADSIDDRSERAMVINTLLESGKGIIDITEDQMCKFAGNMLQVEDQTGKLYLVMSQSAYESLRENQIENLKLYNDIISVSIPTIEKYGGGSVRCMMAEVFLSKIK